MSLPVWPDGVSEAPVRAVAAAVAPGRVIGWNADAQTATVDGELLPCMARVEQGAAYVPIRKLAAALGLGLTVDMKKRRVDLVSGPNNR